MKRNPTRQHPSEQGSGRLPPDVVMCLVTMSSADQNPQNPWQVIIVWAVLFGFGLWFSKNLLEPVLEPVAANHFFKQIPTPNSKDIPVRIVDTSALYDKGLRQGIDALPPKRLIMVLDAIALLPKERWPVAVGLDFNFSKRPEELTNGIKHDDNHQILIDAAQRFQLRTGITVFLGLQDLRDLPKSAISCSPGVPESDGHEPRPCSDMGAYIQLDREEHLAMPVSFNYRTDALDLNNQPVIERGYTLGAKLALALGASSGSGVQSVRPISKLTELKALRCEVQQVLVNHSVLRLRHDLTVQAGKFLVDWKTGDVTERIEPKTLKAQNLFDDTEKQVLTSGPSKYVVLIGNTMMNDGEDTAVYQPEAGWVSSGESIRGIYQHASLVYSLMTNRIVPLSHGWSVLLDLLLSILSLVVVIFTKFKKEDLPPQEEEGGGQAAESTSKPGSPKKKRMWVSRENHALEVWLKALLFAFAIAVPFILAKFEFLWFGFVATLVYILFEEFLSTLIQSTMDHIQRVRKKKTGKEST